MGRHAGGAHEGVDEGTSLAPEPALHGGAQRAAGGVVVLGGVWQVDKAINTTVTTTRLGVLTACQ